MGLQPSLLPGFRHKHHDADEITPTKWAGKHLARLDSFALVVLPLAAALATIESGVGLPLGGTEIILEVCGVPGGLGSSAGLFGLAVDMIGITLAFSIVLKDCIMSAAVGNLLPMVSPHPGLHQRHRRVWCLAQCSPLGRDVLCAAAGRIRRETERAIKFLARTDLAGAACWRFWQVFAHLAIFESLSAHR